MSTPDNEPNPILAEERARMDLVEAQIAQIKEERIAAGEERARQRLEVYERSIAEADEILGNQPKFTPDEASERKRRQRQLNRQHTNNALLLANFTRNIGSTVLAALPGSDLEGFLDVFKNLSRVNHYRMYGSAGLVQGPNNTDYDGRTDFGTSLSEYRRREGFKVLGFSGYDFEVGQQHGDSDIHERVAEIMAEEKPDFVHKEGIGIMLVGNIQAESALANFPPADIPEPSFFPQIQGRWVLGPDNSLYVPQSYNAHIDPAIRDAANAQNGDQPS